jgi:hypothetical protein
MLIADSKVMELWRMREWVCGSKDRCFVGRGCDWLVIWKKIGQEA